MQQGGELVVAQAATGLIQRHVIAGLTELKEKREVREEARKGMKQKKSKTMYW